MNTLHTTKNTAKNTTDENRVFDFLCSQHTGVLSTVDQQGLPHASVIYYAIDPDFKVRFQTKRSTKKSQNLTHRPYATLVVYDEMRQITATLSGHVKEVNNPDLKNELFRSALRSSLHTSEKCVPPVSKINAGEYVSYELTDPEVRMNVYE